jgi:hypothetical protein
MGFFRREKSHRPPAVQHAVITHLPLSGDECGGTAQRTTRLPAKNAFRSF